MSPEIIISCNHLTVAYEDKLALEDVTFDIHRNEFWGILGPNGSGKTTLLKSMLGLVAPVSGSIRVLGVAPANLGPLRDKIGYVPQHSQVDFNFPLQVREMVLLGRCRKMGLGKRAKKEDYEAVDKALERVEMSAFARRQIGRLSGGERQRALIARALALEPEIMLLDEPTAALDVGVTEGFYEWLNHMHSQLHMTLVLVSHDVGVVSQFVSAIACLNKTLVAHGRPAEVLNQESLEQMYGCEVMLFQHGRVPHMVVPSPAHQHEHQHH